MTAACTSVYATRATPPPSARTVPFALLRLAPSPPLGLCRGVQFGMQQQHDNDNIPPLYPVGGFVFRERSVEYILCSHIYKIEYKT